MVDEEPSILAAGALLWRRGPLGPRFALVHRARQNDWSLPKGKLEDGEHPLDAAVREVTEETGVLPVLGRPLKSIRYHVSGRLKQVDYWVGEPSGAVPVFTPNAEIDALTWADDRAARALLSYDHDAQLLTEFAKAPGHTTPYVLMRHASAGDKGRFRDDDTLRPLDSKGRGDAHRLAAVASYGPMRVFSSPTARCLETVLPLAARMRVRAGTATEFGIGNAEVGADHLARLLREEVPTLVCTHGELIPSLLNRALDLLGASATARPPDPTLRKGHLWVLHIAAGCLVALEHHTP